MDQVAVFQLRGPYGHYRKNYSPVSPVTFPCPTPTATIGTIAGIIGLDKREYLKQFTSGSWRLGISLLSPVTKYRAAINLINTKLDPKTFRPKGKSPRIQIPFEFLKDACYRIYFWHENDELFQSLAGHLENGTTIYTPSLGLAQCIADVEFESMVKPKKVSSTHAIEVDSVVPLTEQAGVVYEVSKRYQRFTVPVSMKPGRIVTKYQEAVVEEDAGAVRVSNVDAFKCDDATVVFFESA